MSDLIVGIDLGTTNSEIASFVDRKSTRLNSSHEWSSYAVFCLKKKKVCVAKHSSLSRRLTYRGILDIISIDLEELRSSTKITTLDNPSLIPIPYVMTGRSQTYN